MFGISSKVEKIVKYFNDKHIIKTELNYENEYQLLIAIILSAQCTDKRINLVTPRLFSKYNNFGDLSNAKKEDVLELIKSISYPNDKSKRIINVSKVIHNKYHDKVINDFNKLIEIDGIGRKTANLILSILYNYQGIAVDTHVARVSKRLGLVSSKNPNIIERELSCIFPKEYHNKLNPWFVIFGRYHCKAFNPNCKKCELKEICYEAKN